MEQNSNTANTNNQTAQSIPIGQTLPDYPTGSNLAINNNINYCTFDTLKKEQLAAIDLTNQLLSPLTDSSQMIYVAPSINDSKLENCAGDLSFIIKNQIANSSKFTIAQYDDENASIGSIPALIRFARANNIQYILASFINVKEQKVYVSIRIFDVNGHTISQGSQEI